MENLTQNLGIIILAAGKGTRMQSDLAKVLHFVAGRPMLSYVLDTAYELHPSKLAVVIGHQEQEVRQTFKAQKDVSWVRQKEMRGTGDAVRSASDEFKEHQGPILVLYGDIPGIRAETLRRLGMFHNSSKNVVTILTADLDDPTGYGRVIVDVEGSVKRIVEEKDASEDERAITEINTGIGLYDSDFLFEAVKKLKPNNRQNEFYLTDVVEVARKQGKSIGRMKIRDEIEILGINNREHLAGLSRFFFEIKSTELLASGVTLKDPVTTCIEPTVEIGKDSVIGSHVNIEGNTQIGMKANLGSQVYMRASEIGSFVQLGCNTSVVGALIGSNTVIGNNTSIGRR